MSCERFERWISDGLDNALPPGARQKLDRHLAGCEACRAYLESLERLQREARQACVTDYSPEYGRELSAKLKDRLEQDEDRLPAGTAVFTRRAWTRGLAAASVAAAALLVVIVAGTRSMPRAEVYALSEEDVFSRIYQEFSESPAVERALNEDLLAALDEDLGTGQELLPLNPLDPALLVEGITDEDMRLLDEEISKDRS